MFRGRLHSLADVPTIVSTFKARFPNTVVWFDATAVNVLLDPVKMDQFFLLPIEKTEIFGSVEELDVNGPHRFEQEELIQEIRTTWAGYLIDTTFLSAVRTLKWETRAAASGEVEPSSTAMRESVERKVVGADSIAESIEFLLPVLDLAGLTKPHRIRVTVTLDLRNRRIILRPSGGDIIVAVRSAELELRAVLLDLLGAVPLIVPDGSGDSHVVVDPAAKGLCPLIGGSPALIGTV